MLGNIGRGEYIREKRSAMFAWLDPHRPEEFQPPEYLEAPDQLSMANSASRLAHRNSKHPDPASLERKKEGAKHPPLRAALDRELAN